MDSDQQYYQDLAFSFLSDIEAMEDKTQICLKLHSTLQKFGAHCFGMVDLDPFREPPDVDMDLYDTWPKEWFEHYQSSGYLQIDPIVSYASFSLTPFYWQEAITRQNVSSGGQRLMNEAREFGFNDGFLVPIHTASAKTGTITIVGKRLDKAPHAGFALHMIGMYAYMEIRKRQSGSVTAPRQNRHELLTQREREILKWAAEGKSNWEIGVILDISHNTVRNHIWNTTRKLNVRNRRQAISLILNRVQ